MGKGWDHAVPQMSYWKETLRISKPGSFLISMGGTRTFHRLTCEIEDAGWEIRDCISWLYGSGFPKSHNHFGIEGYGTALKPAWEPCIVAMKPCDGNFKENAEKWGQAGINIDGCRIEGNWERSTPYVNDIRGGNFIQDEIKRLPCAPQKFHAKGRWPANVILDEEAGKMLDVQSGHLSSGQLNREKICAENKIYGTSPKKMVGKYAANSGGASRFFYCAKASPCERNEGLAGMPQKNNHPTVKPIKLMEYLIKLIMPPKDGILLDPFAGSGTTILAAKRLGFDAVGIEKSEEYCTISNARIASIMI